MCRAKKTIQKLIASDKDKKIGNHRLEIKEDGQRWYYYHNTPIVKQIDPRSPYETFIISNGGWNTRSTNDNIREYKRQLNIG